MTTKIITYVFYDKTGGYPKHQGLQQLVIAHDLHTIMEKYPDHKDLFASLIENKTEMHTRSAGLEPDELEKYDFGMVQVAALMFDHIDMEDLKEGENAFEIMVDNDPFSPRRTWIIISTTTNELKKTERGDEYKYGSWRLYKRSDTFTLASYRENTTTAPDIPSEIEGIPVTTLGCQVFFDLKTDTLSIPENITTIDTHAIENCHLNKLILSKSIERIYDNFIYNSEINEIIIPQENRNFTLINGIVFNKEITRMLHYPVTKSGDTFVIPSSVETVDSDCFINQKYLSRISVGNRVKRLYPIKTEKLEYISVDSDNVAYKDENGVLFTKDGKTLLSYPSCRKDTSYSVPESVTEIGKEAFYQCQYLERITIPPSVEKIGTSAFERCKALTGVAIPPKVKELAYSVFSRCSSLKLLSLPSSLEKINAYAVSRCPELEEITVPSSVIKIEQGFLTDCTALQSICIVKDSYADTYLHSEENKRWSNPDAEKLIKYMPANQ